MKQLQLLMGMPITVEVVDPGVTEADIEKVFAYFRAVDETFSTYKEHSEISKINRGELFENEYSDDMKMILALSEQTRQETQGYFDIRHIGPIYSTPELALVIGNVYSYIVSPKLKVVLKLKRKSKISSGIVDFAFKPSQRLVFAPGQYMELTLAHQKPDSRGNRRFFTIASSPTEESLHLGVRFYSESSSFKRALYRIDSRTTIIAGQVAGDFTLPPDAGQKLVFMAGGVGITPFRSMLKYLLDEQQRRDIVLFYANRTADEIAYKDILGEAQTKLGIKVLYTLTNTEALPRNWHGLTGRINERMIQQAVPDFQERTYYLSGPPEMVRAYEHILRNMRVRQEQIKKDFFPGLV